VKIDTILFDLDGTVLDTNNLIVQSFQHTYRTVSGIEKDREYIVKSFGEPLALTMKREFNVPVEEAIQIYRSFHHESFENLIEIFPGMAEAVISLFNKGYKLGVVTSRLRNTSIRGLEKYHLMEYFQCIITADDTKKHKPDPEPINMALKKLQSKPEQTLMIGDSLFDIKCAQNAGVQSAIVAWSELSAEEYMIESPDYVIEKVEDIIKILER